ncbi:MAG: DUF3482 domain-containing protein, partial [Comamonas sp.]
RHALQRLGQTWQARNEALFTESLQRLAAHLHACAALVKTGTNAARYVELLQALDAALRDLHGHTAATGPALRQLPPPTQGAPTASGDTAALAVGTSVGAAAGVAAGAKVGAMIDVGTGGLTLGVGTVLGALLGGTTAWAMRALQKKEVQKGDADELLRRMVEDACTRYLVLAHLGRMPAAQADERGARWHADVVATVAAHWAALTTTLNTEPAPDDTLQPLLRTMLRGVLSRETT